MFPSYFQLNTTEKYFASGNNGSLIAKLENIGKTCTLPADVSGNIITSFARA